MVVTLEPGDNSFPNIEICKNDGTKVLNSCNNYSLIDGRIEPANAEEGRNGVVCGLNGDIASIGHRRDEYANTALIPCGARTEVLRRCVHGISDSSANLMEDWREMSGTSSWHLSCSLYKPHEISPNRRSRLLDWLKRRVRFKSTVLRPRRGSFLLRQMLLFMVRSYHGRRRRD
jgi:hypothetical protein